MRYRTLADVAVLLMILLLFGTVQTYGDIVSQFVPDTDGIDTDGDGDPNNDHVFRHLAAGDGFVNMADGKLQYIFGFSDVTGVPDDMVMHHGGMLAAEFPAPTLVFKEGQQVYLNLTQRRHVMRPDLFDPHSVHFHGFPNAAPIFDGEPDSAVVINMGPTFTYYYNIVEPGTFLYHCHVEATEHMQMGMLGNLYVLPKQNNLPDGTDLNGFTHHTGYKYAYNDGDGSTYYDVDYPLQLSGFDPNFHDQHIGVQPLPFAQMDDRYAMINGRGYPETVDTNDLYNTAAAEGYDDVNRPSQKIDALITATKGQKILLRLSNVSTKDFFTITVQGIPMKIVGTGARLLRGPDGKDTSYLTTSVTLGGGETIDAILDTATVAPGTYLLYTTNLNFLSNDKEDFGGHHDRDRRPCAVERPGCATTQKILTDARKQRRQTMNRRVFKWVMLSTSLAVCCGVPAAHAAIHGITGTTFNLSAKSGHISTSDGGSYLMWGYAQDPNEMQYPGPTLIVQEDVAITINLTNTLSVPVSIVFPGQTGVSASGGAPGLLTQRGRPQRRNGQLHLHSLRARHLPLPQRHQPRAADRDGTGRRPDRAARRASTP